MTTLTLTTPTQLFIPNITNVRSFKNPNVNLPPGEWTNEPDKIVWFFTEYNLMGMIVRSEWGGTCVVTLMYLKDIPYMVYIMMKPLLVQYMEAGLMETHVGVTSAIMPYLENLNMFTGLVLTVLILKTYLLNFLTQLVLTKTYTM